MTAMKLKILIILISLSPFSIAGQVNAISYGSEWKYYDSGDINDITWKSSSYDDNLWKFGNGTFGYGFGTTINREVSYGGNPSSRHITTYFRKEIDILNNSDISVELKVNDGAIFYLNGLETHRHNLPSGIITFGTQATNFNSNLATVSFQIPSGSLLTGVNVFAVEIHQVSNYSSTLGFDCKITQNLSHTSSPKFYINEVMASNGQTAIDTEGNNSDWIEIYNGNSTSVNLIGYYFTDDLSEKTQFKIEDNIIIPSDSYHIFWANKDSDSGGNFLDFNLSSNGEFLALVDPDGETIIDSVSFPDLKTDISYGRLFDGDATWRYFMPASFKTVNNPYQAFLGILKPPTLSHTGGYYSSPFDLSISQENTNAEIIYTLDGSSPTKNNITVKNYKYKVHYSSGNFSQGQLKSNVYATPIQIYDKSTESNKISGISTANKYENINSYLPNFNVLKSTPVRAISVKDGYISSDVVTSSFFINSTGQNPFNIPVVSLNMDEDLLFEYDYGIHVNGSGLPNYFDTTEVPLSFELMEQNSVSFQQNLGTKLHGGSSNEHPLKSFRLYARSEYDDDSDIEYPIFSDSGVPSFKRFLLRNSGNDFSIENPDRSLMFKDAFIQESVSNLNFEVQEYRPTVTYLNGEFWGILNLRERYDKFYFREKYGIEEQDLDLIKFHEEVKSGSLDNYDDLLQYFHNYNDWASNPARMAFAEANIDLENYIDYQIAQIFYNNNDWPPNNTMHWRMNNASKFSSDYGMDGKWRWMLFDTDFSMLSQNEKFTSAKNDQVIFKKLMDNRDFKKRLVIRYSDLINTTFKPSRLLSSVDSMAQNIELAIDDHIDRWRGIPDMATWNYSINEVKTYVINRGGLELNYLNRLLGKSGTHELTLIVNNSDKGFIELNTIAIKNGTDGIDNNVYPWSGKYVNNLEIKLVAQPNLGYKFSHWEYNGINDSDSVIYLSSDTDYEVKAVFDDAFLSNNPFPVVKTLTVCSYNFNEWSDNSPSGTFPSNLAFVYMDQTDPLIDSKIVGFTSGRYDLSSKTRINGLNENGISFINTGSGQTGYEETSLGGAILALNTIGYDSLVLEFTAGTVKSKSRAYNLRLEYRIGDKLAFTPLLYNNQEVIYESNNSDGHESKFTISLPDTLLNKEYIQFFWRIYYTGNRRNTESGARDEIRLDDVKVKRYYHLNSTVTNPSSSIDNYDLVKASDITLNTSPTEIKANNAILLEEGFNSGLSVFKAEIETCE